MPGGLPGPWWAIIVLGLAAGVVSGTLGVGSGIIIVPALALVFALPQKSAQGTALAVMVPMALVGAGVAGRVPGLWLRRIFAIFVLTVGVRMFLTTFGRSNPAPGQGPDPGQTSATGDGSENE